MPDVFAATDVVVQPSLEEGLGLAAIEAMQYGVPLIASDVVGLNEVVQDGTDGLLVAPRDPGAIASAVVQILDNSSMAASLIAGGLKSVSQRFSIDAMRDGTLSAYEAALENRHSRA